MRDMSDDEVMRELKTAWSERELVTDSARESAKAAFTWRTIDTELMMLSYDSLLEDTAAVRRSGSQQPRTIAFQGTGISLEIEIDGTRLLGQIVPGQACAVALGRPGGNARTADADADGFFVFEDVGGGSVRITLEVDGRRLATDWMTV